MSSRRLLVGSVAAIATLSVFVGCAGGIEGGTGTGGSGGVQCVPNGGVTTPPATFATVKVAFSGNIPNYGAVTSCVSAPCHGLGGQAPPPPEKPLILQDDANLYMNMMTYVAHQCGDMPLVTPGKPDQSALVKILSGPCGNVVRMPYDCMDEQCMPAEYLAAITQWILNCAPQQ